MEKVIMTAGRLMAILETVPDDILVYAKAEDKNSERHGVVGVDIIHYVDQQTGEIKKRFEITAEEF